MFPRVCSPVMMNYMTSAAKKLKQQAMKLAQPDRLALALALWGSMHDPAPEVEAGEREFAKQRLAEHRKSPKETISWAESKRRLAKKSGQ